jgi:hypothetical protein
MTSSARQPESRQKPSASAALRSHFAPIGSRPSDAAASEFRRQPGIVAGAGGRTPATACDGVFGRATDGGTGLLCCVAGYGSLAFAISPWMVAPAVMLVALGGLATPSVRSMVSGRGDADTQREMQRLLASVESLTAVVAPLLAAGLFSRLRRKCFRCFSRAPVLVRGGFAALGAVLMQRL